jgi:hypothetical protein
MVNYFGADYRHSRKIMKDGAIMEQFIKPAFFAKSIYGGICNKKHHYMRIIFGLAVNFY